MPENVANQRPHVPYVKRLLDALIRHVIEELARAGSAEGDAGTMTNILQMQVVPPSTVGFKPPAVLDAICLRALEKDPAKRWNSALEMEDALRDAAMRRRVRGTRAEGGGLPRRWPHLDTARLDHEAPLHG